MGFSIESGASIHLKCTFNSRKFFSLGKNSTINQFCKIDNRGGISIGNNVSISPYVQIITADHDLIDPDYSGRQLPVTIEDHCFIGSDAMVMPGCTMKKGSALGAKSLLSKSTEENLIYVGIPARPIGKRTGNFTYTTSYKRWFH